MDSTFNADRFLDEAARAMALHIAPAHRAGVVLNLERIAAMARLVAEFPLPDEVEPAPVYRP